MTMSHQPTAQGRDEAPRRSIVGVTRWMRSERASDPPCVCCGGGPHIFGYLLDLPKWADRDYHLDPAMWLHEAVRAMPEGAQVRVTVEALNAPPEQPVTDTRERLNRAVERLTERRDDPAIGRLERARLDGKVEGVKLALSYLNDVPRDCECHHRDFAAPHAPGCVYR